MARLFFAIVPPPAVSELLDDVCEGLSDVDWTDAADFHLTLAFLGEVSERHLQDLVDVGRTVRTPSFRLELESVGVFSSRGRPRVLWAGVRKEEKLLALQRVLSRELRQAGFELEQRKFHPHLTLGRPDDCPADEISDWLGRHLSLRAGPFGVFEFRLISSQRPGHGPRYVTLERFPLGV